jgi:hypothetical protein
MNERRDEEEDDFELFENVHLKIKEDKKLIVIKLFDDIR